METVPQDQYITNISGKIASGSAPDIYWSNDDFPACLGCLQPIEVSKIDLNDSLWDKTVSDLSTLGGKVYLVNAIGNSGRDICFYNKKLLNDNNIKTPDDYLEEDNWTWETMTKLMRPGKLARNRLLRRLCGYGDLLGQRGRFVLPL